MEYIRCSRNLLPNFSWGSDDFIPRRPADVGSQVLLNPAEARTSLYVGRVGALAIALGAGAAIAALPVVAFADTTGSSGSSASASSDAGPSSGPKRPAQQRSHSVPSSTMQKSDGSAKSADQRLRRTVVREDSPVVTCCAHVGCGGPLSVFVVVVPAKTLVPLSL